MSDNLVLDVQRFCRLTEPAMQALMDTLGYGGLGEWWQDLRRAETPASYRSHRVARSLDIEGSADSIQHVADSVHDFAAELILTYEALCATGQRPLKIRAPRLHWTREHFELAVVFLVDGDRPDA